MVRLLGLEAAMPYLMEGKLFGPQDKLRSIQQKREVHVPAYVDVFKFRYAKVDSAGGGETQ